MLEQFAAAAASCSGRNQPILQLLCDLFALSTLERDRAWFLECGYLTGAKAKAIRSLVNELCRETRTHALALVRAFGIPRECLGAPIALADSEETDARNAPGVRPGAMDDKR